MYYLHGTNGCALSEDEPENGRRRGVMSTVKETKATKKTASAKKTEIMDEAKKVAEKVAEKAADGKKAVEKKVAETKATVKKTAEKKTAKAASVKIIVEYAGNQTDADMLAETAKADWAANGHELLKLKSCELYIKPEEKTCYYVINGVDTGKIFY